MVLLLVTLAFAWGESISNIGMKALAASHFGDFRQVLSLQEVTSLQSEPLGPYDLLVQVAWSDVNPVDLQKLGGGWRAGEPVDDPPFVTGFAGSGVVVKQGEGTPDVKSFPAGTRVSFLVNPSSCRGSYAEYCIVDSRAVAVIPKDVSIRDASCVPLAGCTAFESLQKLALCDKVKTTDVNDSMTEKKIKTGKTLLIVGAAGGVGSWAIRLARAFQPDLEIIATVSSTESEDWCLAGGASKCIQHNEIETLGGGPRGSVDAILCLTEPTPPVMKAMSEVIRPYGRICLVVAGASIQTLDLGFLFFKSATLSLETVFSCFRTGFAEINPAEEIADILDLLASQKISVPLSPILESLDEDWNKALSGGLLDALREGHSRGKLILRVGGESSLTLFEEGENSEVDKDSLPASEVA